MAADPAEQRSPEIIPATDILSPTSPLLGSSNLPESSLGRSLRWLELFLLVLGFHRSLSPLTFVLSCSIFLILGVATPAVVIYLSSCTAPACHEYQIDRYELWSFFFDAFLAAISLACISTNLFKYGMRKFLFVDQQHGEMQRLHGRYAEKIKDFFSLLFWWTLPCFLVKTAREIIRFLHVPNESPLKTFVTFMASIISWSYLTIIYFCACLFFNLVCNLQIIHFEDYSKLMEADTDCITFLQEHMRLRYYLSKISHRFRIYLLLLLLVVTASQFVTLFETTGGSERVNFSNAGDLAVSSVVQVVGIVLCLLAASKISHRAQGISSLASKWHAVLTCASERVANNHQNLDAISSAHLALNYSENDLEAIDNICVHTNAPLVANLSPYNKRQALVLYFQSNAGGFTIFGWTIDRTLINTLFFLELSMVLFVLGKTLVFTSLSGFPV